MRYHLVYSSAFDVAPFTYHMDKYKQAVKLSGGKNVRSACQWGWSNMPKVVTWNGDVDTNKRIETALLVLPPFDTLKCASPIIREQDW